MKGFRVLAVSLDDAGQKAPPGNTVKKPGESNQ